MRRHHGGGFTGFLLSFLCERRGDNNSSVSCLLLGDILTGVFVVLMVFLGLPFHDVFSCKELFVRFGVVNQSRRRLVEHFTSGLVTRNAFGGQPYTR
jgi:hypothetical protein